MAYVILKTKERKRRPMMQRLFMGLIVTAGVFFSYDYLFTLELDVTFEPNEITTQSIEYTMMVSELPKDVDSLLLIVTDNDLVYQNSTRDTVFSDTLLDLDANTEYTFTLYTVTESTQAQIYEITLITKEMDDDE